MKQKENKSISRRDFAKMSAAALSSFAVLRGASAQGSSEVLKVGLLGCGSRGTGALMQMLQGNDNVQVIALADVFPDKVGRTRRQVEANPQFAEKRDIQDDHCFTGLDAYKSILETDIDILLEGTLPYSRPGHLEAAVEAGKHIFTEKPVAVDPVGVHQVLRASRRADELGLSWVSGTQRRHDKQYRETVAKIHDGAIGDIVSMRAYWCGGLPFVHERNPEWSDLEYCIRNWYAHCWVCGDNIVEQHMHNIDVCHWVMEGFGIDHPISVFASGGRQFKPDEPKYGDLWDHFSCDFEFPNNVHLTSMSRHWDGLDGGVFEHVYGTNGNSSCRDMGEGPGIDPMVQEHINLVNSITGEGPHLNEGVTVSYSTMATIMGRISAYNGRRVTWEDVMEGRLKDYSIVPELDWDAEYPNRPVPVPGKAGAGNLPELHQR